MTPQEFENLKNKVNDSPVQLRVASGSMIPILKVNDIVTVTKLDRTMNVFDVIVYFFGDQIRCHYLWRNQLDFNDSIVTRSLQDIYHDETPIPKKHILGILPKVKIPALTKFKILLLNILVFWK